MLNTKPENLHEDSLLENSLHETSLHENMRYVFDLNDMQFIVPPGDAPQEPFEITLTFNGVDIEEELTKLDFLSLVLSKLNDDTEDKEVRLQLEEAIENLNERKNIILENVTTFIREFWLNLEEMDDEDFCPLCGHPYFIQYLEEDDGDRCTSAAG